jgi:di/tricarboxylate transporter
MLYARAHVMPEQAVVIAVLILVAALFVWGRWRYDLVALIALLVLAVTRIVPADRVFHGFGHPAVITIAAVLVISRGLEQAGVVDVMSRLLLRAGQRPAVQVAALCVLGATLSAFMNNVGALALLMPVAVHMARRDRRSPAVLLMPLAFATLLGGLATLVGSPPNIIISALRREEMGRSFDMFDFAPVGVPAAVAGLLLIILAASRLVPRRQAPASREALFELAAYTTELRVPVGSPAAGKSLAELTREIDDAVVAVIIRGDRRFHAPVGRDQIRAGDALVVEADAASIKRLVDQGLALAGSRADGAEEELRSDGAQVVEAVVRPGSFVEGRSAADIQLRRVYHVNLLAVAREGHRIAERLSQVRFRAGDVLLLQGEVEPMAQAMSALGCLPLAKRELELPRPRRLAAAVGVFAAAISTAAMNLVAIEIAFAAAAVLLILLRIVSLRQAYDAIDAPVLVLLGAMLPVGEAFGTTGGAALLADGLLGVGHDVPSWAILAIVLFGTALLSNLINTKAIAVVMAPVAIAVAAGLGASADPFLMAVAIGASSAFLTPVGHPCNALVLGPGGYRFGDYWKLGLPTTVAVTLVSVPLILWAWPLR